MKKLTTILSLTAMLSVTILSTGCVSRRTTVPADGTSAETTPAETTAGEPTTKKIPVSHIIEFEDGGKDYVYIVDGIENHFLVPPEDFNPITATDEELARYCFPPRPTTEAGIKQWENQMKNYEITPPPNLDITIEVWNPDPDSHNN